MTVVFRLPGPTSANGDVFTVGCSPLAEACFSLRVLVNPTPFRAHWGWIGGARRLPADLRGGLRELAPLFAHSIPGFLTATTSGSSTFAGELARVASVREDEAQAEVLTVLETFARLYDRQGASGALRTRADELRTEWEQHPRQALARLVGLFERYWSAVFRNEWERRGPELLSEARTCAERARSGLDFASQSGIELCDGSITVRTACRYLERVVPAGGQLTLAPSSFLWPRVSVESSAPWPFAIFYPCGANLKRATVSDAASDMLPALRALADGTRLAIMRLIIGQPRSTQELAELVAMSEPAVSQHLRQLRAAGLVATRRSGHYVLYSAEPRSLRRLAAALTDLSAKDVEPG